MAIAVNAELACDQDCCKIKPMSRWLRMSYTTSYCLFEVGQTHVHMHASRPEHASADRPQLASKTSSCTRMYSLQTWLQLALLQTKLSLRKTYMSLPLPGSSLYHIHLLSGLHALMCLSAITDHMLTLLAAPLPQASPNIQHTAAWQCL